MDYTLTIHNLQRCAIKRPNCQLCGASLKSIYKHTAIIHMCQTCAATSLFVLLNRFLVTLGALDAGIYRHILIYIHICIYIYIYVCVCHDHL